jgi:hypothetical protein
MILRKPKVHEVILLLENLFERFRVVHNFEEIKALAPDLDVLATLREKLSQLREEARDYLVGNGMAVHKPPLWKKNNNPEEWWSVKNFEILCASYQHKVEGFLKMVSPYFPRGSKSEDDILSRTPHLVLLDKMPQFLSFLLHDELRYKDLEMNKTTSLLYLLSLVKEDLLLYLEMMSLAFL